VPKSSHLSQWAIELLAEDSLPRVQREAAEQHLRVCARCSGQLAEFRSFYAELAQLPRFAPSLGFADAVMAQVRIPEARPAASPAWYVRWVPATPRAWAGLVTASLLPLLPIAALVWLVLTRPGTAAAFIGWGAVRVQEGFISFLVAAAARYAETPLAALVNALVSAASALPAEMLRGGAAIGFALLLLSAWSLYRLALHPAQGSGHAH
jgi:anti-sigma factor RsiW